MAIGRRRASDVMSTSSINECGRKYFDMLECPGQERMGGSSALCADFIGETEADETRISVLSHGQPAAYRPTRLALADRYRGVLGTTHRQGWI